MSLWGAVPLQDFQELVISPGVLEDAATDPEMTYARMRGITESLVGIGLQSDMPDGYRAHLLEAIALLTHLSRWHDSHPVMLGYEVPEEPPLP